MVKIILMVATIFTIGYGTGFIIQVKAERIDRVNIMEFAEICADAGGKYDHIKDDCELRW